MIDLSDVTFIIPIRIESSDRYRNLTLSFTYLIKNTNAKIIIMESDKKRTAQKAINTIMTSHPSCTNRVLYIFSESNESLFHRTKMLNNMIIESKTPIIANYDCDVLLPLSSYEKAAEMCRGKYDLVYPYSFGDKSVFNVALAANEVIDFTDSFNLDTLKGFWGRAEYGFCQFFKKTSYIGGFMENENFLSYGPEDVERGIRWEKLGYEVGRLNKTVYHLEHTRTENSWVTNPHMKTNVDLFSILSKMKKSELENYYNSQKYYQDNLEKIHAVASKKQSEIL